MGKSDPEILKMVKNFKESIKSKYNVVNIVFFGSRANGTAREDSDIDLIVVVRRYDKNLVEKLLTEWHEKQNIHYPVDFIQFSKEKFDELSKGINIVSQAVEDGIVV